MKAYKILFTLPALLIGAFVAGPLFSQECTESDDQDECCSQARNECWSEVYVDDETPTFLDREKWSTSWPGRKEDPFYEDLTE